MAAPSCPRRAGCRKLQLGDLEPEHPTKLNGEWAASLVGLHAGSNTSLPQSNLMDVCGQDCTGLRLGNPVVFPALNTKPCKQKPRGTRKKGRCGTHTFLCPLSTARALLPIPSCQTICWPKPPAHHTLPAPFSHAEDAPIKSCPSSSSALDSTQCNFWEALDLICVCPTSQAPQLPSCSLPFELITKIKAKTQSGRFADSSSPFLQTAFAVALLHKSTQAHPVASVQGIPKKGSVLTHPSQAPAISLGTLQTMRATSHRSFKREAKGGSKAGEQVPRAARKDSRP